MAEGDSCCLGSSHLLPLPRSSHLHSHLHLLSVTHTPPPRLLSSSPFLFLQSLFLHDTLICDETSLKLQWSLPEIFLLPYSNFIHDHLFPCFLWKNRHVFMSVAFMSPAYVYKPHTRTGLHQSTLCHFCFLTIWKNKTKQQKNSK